MFYLWYEFSKTAVSAIVKCHDQSTLAMAIHIELELLVE